MWPLKKVSYTIVWVVGNLVNEKVFIFFTPAAEELIKFRKAKGGT